LVRSGGFIVSAAYFGFFIERKFWKTYLAIIYLAENIPIALCTIIFGITSTAASSESGYFVTVIIMLVIIPLNIIPIYWMQPI
jgi:hypothetical protein